MLEILFFLFSFHFYVSQMRLITCHLLKEGTSGNIIFFILSNLFSFHPIYFLSSLYSPSMHLKVEILKHMKFQHLSVRMTQLSMTSTWNLQVQHKIYEIHSSFWRTCIQCLKWQQILLFGLLNPLVAILKESFMD